MRPFEKNGAEGEINQPFPAWEGLDCFISVEHGANVTAKEKEAAI